MYVFWLWLLSQALTHTTKGDKATTFSFSGDEGGLFPAKTHLNKMKMDFAAGVNSSQSCKNIFSGERFLFRSLTLPVSISS